MHADHSRCISSLWLRCAFAFCFAIYLFLFILVAVYFSHF
jgi:hypothetical protein